MPFNPEMLTLARQAGEMTQAALAELCGITQGRVSKIEHGLLEPPPELIARFAEKLERPESFFSMEGHNYGLPIRHHRKRERVGQTVLERIHAELNIRALQLRELLRSAVFDADLELPRIDIDDMNGAADEVARALRSLWQMPRGPVANVLRLLERAGVLVVPHDFRGAEVDAIAHSVPGVPPIVFFNQATPPDRLRFTLAHELAHLIMHALPNSEMERQANDFAAEFLMPAADIRHQLSRVTLALLANLKLVWRVSMSSLLYHAKRLGTITQRRFVQLRTQLSGQGYLKREPIELDPPRELPTLFYRLSEYFTTRLEYSLEEFAKVVRERPESARQNFFRQTGGLQLVE